MRVMIADDAVLFREGLARVLTEAGFEVAAQAGNAASLLDHVRRDQPDAVVVDIRMPPTDGCSSACWCSRPTSSPTSHCS